MIGLTVILTILSLLSLSNGFYGNAPGMVVLGVGFIILLLIIRFRFKVGFDEQKLSSTSFFSTKTLKWNEINKVVRMWDYGYPKNRLYGPYVYEFQTSNDNLKINFKLFPIECGSEILNKVKELTSASK